MFQRNCEISLANIVVRPKARRRVSLLRQHITVTIALLIREMATRFGNKPGGYVWAVLDPFLHVLLMTLVFQSIARIPALGPSFPLFFASGYLPFLFYQGMSSFIAGAVKSNRALFSYPVVSPIDAVISRFVLQSFTASFVTILILMAVIAKDDIDSHLNVSELIGAGALAALLGLGVGLINIGLFSRFPLYEQIFTIFNRPVFMISGVFFLPDSLPRPYSDYILWNPLVHVIMKFRQGIYPEYRASGLDEFYLVQVVAVLGLVGLAIFTGSARALREG